MGQPVKLSDELVGEARNTAELSQRSIAGQIEFWAVLGKALEPVLRGDRAIALRQAGKIRPLSQAIATVDTSAGRQRVSDYLAAGPFPHYEPLPDRPGLLRRIEQDGTQSIGRFVHRVFEPIDR